MDRIVVCTQLWLRKRRNRLKGFRKSSWLIELYSFIRKFADTVILNGRPESNLQLTIGEIKRIVQFPAYESLLFEITFISFINVYIYICYLLLLYFIDRGRKKFEKKEEEKRDDKTSHSNAILLARRRFVWLDSIRCSVLYLLRIGLRRFQFVAPSAKLLLITAN